LRALGNGQLDLESREAATENEQPVIAVAPSGLDYFRWIVPKARKASPWA